MNLANKCDSRHSNVQNDGIFCKYTEKHPPTCCLNVNKHMPFKKSRFARVNAQLEDRLLVATNSKRNDEYTN